MTTTSKWNRIKPWLGLTGIFIAGMLLGSLLTVKIAMNRLHHLAQGGPVEIRALIVKRLDHELKLTPEQKTAVEKIVEAHQEKMKDLRKQMLPQVTQNLMDGQKEIEATLNPEQKETFDAWAEKQRERLNRFL